MAQIDFAALRTATSLRSDCCVDDGTLLAGGNKMNGEPQRLLPPATLAEEDEFYSDDGEFTLHLVFLKLRKKGDNNHV